MSWSNNFENKKISLYSNIKVCNIYEVDFLKKKNETFQVGRFLLIAFECLPLTLFQSYLMIDEEVLTDRRIAGITLSLFTTSFVISEIEPSPDYEIKYRYLLNFTYRMTEVSR